MIVGTCFDDDNDDRTKWAQHELYGRALESIVHACKAHLRAAESLLRTGDADVRKFHSLARFDHRVLQWAHDLLAAAWRYRNHRLSPSLPFDDDASFRAEIESSWLTWLDGELAAWNERPALVRSVMFALVHENTPRGYDAEEALLHGIVHAYADVPWTDNIHRLARIAEDTAERGTGSVAAPVNEDHGI